MDVLYAITETRLVKKEGWDLYGFMGSRVILISDSLQECKKALRSYVKEHYGMTVKIQVQDDDDLEYFEAEISPTPNRIVQFVAQPFLKSKI